MNPQSILSFWFDETTPAQWYKKDDAFDSIVRTRFRQIHDAARACELASWRVDADGRLAEILVLDQFSRNMYRGDARAFACDPVALVLSQEAIARDVMSQLDPRQSAFILMPVMHSESLAVHDAYAAYFRLPGLEGTADFELRHRKILEQFGRYPHRNASMGRASSARELAFLEQPGSSF